MDHRALGPGQRRHHLGGARTTPGQWTDAGREHWRVPHLIRIEGGALSHYILDRTWSDRERWDELDTARLRDRLHTYLSSLDPENAEHAALIKIVIKAACRAHLRRDPDVYREQLLAQPAQTTERHLETAALCEIMADYITRKLAYATRAAARLRIAAIKELLRVPVLRYIARDRRDTRVRDAIASALDACLLDEDRLVRIETLRALWGMLRNVAVMADQATNRQEFLAALFPDGLGSLEWLLERLIGGLLRFPSFTRRSALIGAAWFHVSVLLPVFRIFSDHTLALCNHLIVKGLGLEVVAMCVRSLRGRDAEEIRHRIDHLYLLQSLDEPYSRDEYIELYKVSIEARTPGKAVAAPPAAERPWYEFDDTVLSGELTRLLDRLARMWEAGDDRQILQPVQLAPDSPYRAIERAVEELSQIAHDLSQAASPARPRSLDVPDAIERLAELGARYRSSVDEAPSLTAPIRAVLSEIVKAWQWIYSPPAPDSGTQIYDGYVLDAPVVQGSNVFRVREPAKWRDRYVVSIFQKWNHPGAAARFLDAARFTKELRSEQGYGAHIVEITEIIKERPYYAYVMRDHGESLEVRLENDRPSTERMAWADHAARQLGRVLELIHGRSGYHGSIKLSHVFVGSEKSNQDPVFFLGGLAHNEQTHDRSVPISGVPESLRQKCQVDDDLSKRQWGDIVALSWVLYQILDGALKPIPADPRDLDSSLNRLQEAAKSRVALKNVIATLKRVFDTGTQSFGISEFLEILNGPSGSNQSGLGKRDGADRVKVDIGILTIREDEFRAVLDAFPQKAGDKVHRGASRQYILRHAEAATGERYTVAILRQVEQGTGEAQHIARDLIEDLAPKLVLVVGIAGGLPSDDVTLGDVVLGTRIHDFTVEAVGAGHEVTYAASGGLIDTATAAAVATLAGREDELGDWTSTLPSQPAVAWTEEGQVYGPPEWQRELRAKLEHHYGGGAPRRSPTYVSGSIASSDRLVKDPTVLFPWLTTVRNLIAVEMESSGVYRAVRERCPMLAIRGISDIVGLKRADAWTKYACASAAAFARAFLRTRPVSVGL
ncbi:MAG TPA: hypothetical protein VHN14_06915 [Kofleriaceae bacterium]|nr:hypothetical protein [Kofleriaceae bacterium]